MGILNLHLGDTLLINDQRFIAAFEGDNGSWVLEDRVNRETKLYTPEQLFDLKRGGLLELVLPVQDDRQRREFMNLSFSGLKAIEKAAIKRKQDYLWLLQELAPDTPNSKKLTPVIDMVAEILGDPKPPFWTTVKEWRKQAREGGDADPRALLPAFRKRGDRRSQIQAEVEEIIQLEIDRIYLVRRKETTMKDVHTAVRKNIRNRNKGRTEGLLFEPSVKKVQREINKRNKYDVDLARKGKPAADAAWKQVKQPPLVERPLQVVEMDHSVTNDEVIDDETGFKGRPYMTLVMDRATRMILGEHISFLPPSQASSILALRNAIEPKDHVLDEIDDPQADWPCQHVPKTIFTDNGREFHAKNWAGILAHLKISTSFAPLYAPQFKGMIERFHHTIQSDLFHKLDGATMGNPKARGDYDPKKNATMKLSEFRKLIRYWIVMIYHRTPHKALGCSPLEKWHELSRKWRSDLPPSTQELDQIMTLEFERKVNRTGILHDGFRYNSTALNDLLRQGTEVVQDKKLKILVNPRNLGSILVVDPRDGRAFEVPTIDEKAIGLTLWDHVAQKKKAAEDRKNDPYAESVGEARSKLMEEMVVKPKKEAPTEPKEEAETAPEGDLISQFDNFQAHQPEAAHAVVRVKAVEAAEEIVDLFSAEEIERRRAELAARRKGV
jgi:putative transposase